MLHIPLLRHGRLDIGPIATNHIQWDQPHEGNLFDHQFARRAFQRARCIAAVFCSGVISP